MIRFMTTLVLACVMLGASGQIGKAAPAVRLNHLAYMVKDLSKSTRFYMEIMGLDTIPEPFHDGRHSWFRLSEKSQLHLIQGEPPASIIKGNHLCLSVLSVPVFMEKLRNAGVSFENWAGEAGTFTLRPDGVKQVYLRDPDGYWLEVNDAH